jgi:predicted transcriptional regulator
LSDWRTTQAQLLSALAEVSQVKVAALMGISDGTVSGFKSSARGTSQIELTAKLIAALGLRLVPADALIQDPDELQALRTLARKALDLQGVKA